MGGALTVASYYRLLIANLLVEREKAIYLDADLIVEGDLWRLWETSIGIPVSMFGLAFSEHI